MRILLTIDQMVVQCWFVIWYGKTIILQSLDYEKNINRYLLLGMGKIAGSNQHNIYDE